MPQPLLLLLLLLLLLYCFCPRSLCKQASEACCSLQNHLNEGLCLLALASRLPILVETLGAEPSNTGFLMLG